MRGRIDIERQLLARLAPGRARAIGRAVVQDDIDEVVIGMNALFHDSIFQLAREAAGYKRPLPLGQAADTGPVALRPVGAWVPALYRRAAGRFMNGLGGAVGRGIRRTA